MASPSSALSSTARIRHLTPKLLLIILSCPDISKNQKVKCTIRFFKSSPGVELDDFLSIWNKFPGSTNHYAIMTDSGKRLFRIVCAAQLALVPAPKWTPSPEQLAKVSWDVLHRDLLEDGVFDDLKIDLVCSYFKHKDGINIDNVLTIWKLFPGSTDQYALTSDASKTLFKVVSLH